MNGINAWAVVASAVAVFFASTVWYIAFSKQRNQLSDAAKKSAADDNNRRRPQLGKMLLEILRSVILAWVLAYLFQKIGVASAGSAIGYGLLLWVGFPLILLTGSIMWENVPWKLAAIHSGDWLVKLLIVSAILGAWK